jgi:hypothetical protein
MGICAILMQNDPGPLTERAILCVSHNFGRLRFTRLGSVKTTAFETAAQVVQASEQPDSPACDKKSLKVVPPAVHPERQIGGRINTCWFYGEMMRGSRL